jgi:HAD superfamily hydrolase (TIGR01459 family)
MTPHELKSLDAVSEAYSAAFVDIWGVLHNGRAAFPEAVAALQSLRRQGTKVILISNVPKPASGIPSQLARLGCPSDAFDAIVTSGDVTRDAVSALKPGPFFRIGPHYDAPLWDGLDLAWSPIEDAAAIACSGLVDWDTEVPSDYTDLLRRPAAQGVPFICANPDRIVRDGEAVKYCAGSLADLYTSLGGPTVIAGKPHPPIYKLAQETLERLTGRPYADHTVLAIGDGPQTDVEGANRENIDCLFVAGGIHETALRDVEDFRASCERLLSDAGCHARYAMRALA